MKCMSQGCDKEAKWQLGWVAVSRPTPPKKPIMVSGHLALAVCKDHADCDVTHLIDAETKIKVAGGLLMRGAPPPNWTGASCIRKPLINDQFDLPSNKKPAGVRLAS